MDDTNLTKVFRNEIKLNKKEFDFNKKIKLPEIITSPRDLFINFEKENKTNFVTTKGSLFRLSFYQKFQRKYKWKNCSD